MSELICPFCHQEYIITKDDSCFGQQRCVCRNPNCEFDGWHFPVKLVSKLIHTRKALEIAIQYIKHTQSVEPFWFNRLANKTLNEIKTTLEQKDVK